MTAERKPKILVVDDDPRLRDLLRRYLGENGFNVFVAENGQAMNRLWMRERFDALILDLMMPGEDGLAILKRIRAAKMLTVSWGWNSEPMTTSRSPSIRANSSPGCTLCSAAVRRLRRRGPRQAKTKS